MYLGIDLGGTNIAIGLVDADGRILHKEKVKTFADRHYSEVVRDMATLSMKVISDYGASLSDIEWIGIGSPGECDVERGIVINAVNLHFSNTPIVDEFKKYINKPVYLANDADAAAYGEATAGSARGAKKSVMVTLGTGVGGGVILKGKIFQNAELGHTIINYDGRKCKCGQRGCWEAYASVTALRRQTKSAMRKNPDSLMWSFAENIDSVSGRTAFKAALQGDAAAKRVVENYLSYVAVGIVNINRIFSPEVIIIGGGISNEGEYIIEKIEGYCDLNNDVKIKIAHLGNDAGIIGAALLGNIYQSK